MEVGVIGEGIGQRSGIEFAVEAWVMVVRIGVNGECEGAARGALSMKGVLIGGYTAGDDLVVVGGIGIELSNFDILRNGSLKQDWASSVGVVSRFHAICEDD